MRQRKADRRRAVVRHDVGLKVAEDRRRGLGAPVFWADNSFVGIVRRWSGTDAIVQARGFVKDTG